jgi:hypothetical protein
MTPAWTLDIFAALMLVVAVVSVARLVLARPWQRGSAVADTDIAHLLMAIAMAGMLAPGLTIVPDAPWEIIFAMMTAWFAERVAGDARANGRQALAGGHCVPHLVHSAAMLYMFLALERLARSDSPGMAGMGGSAPVMPALHYPTVAFVFALVLIGYTVWDLDQLSDALPGFTVAVASVPDAALAGMPAVAVAGGGSGRGGLHEVLLSAGTTAGCRIVMGVTMALMLLIMV